VDGPLDELAKVLIGGVRLLSTGNPALGWTRLALAFIGAAYGLPPTTGGGTNPLEREVVPLLESPLACALLLPPPINELGLLLVVAVKGVVA
jgi:hypothetical protein